MTPSAASVPPHRTRIKLCGFTREPDVAAALAAGADALGFVFYPPSPRYVSPARAAELSARMPPFVTRVGLFVNESPQRVREILAQTPLDLLQFHGDEDAVYCSQFARPWIKAARVRPGCDLLEYATAFRGAQGLLLDAFVDGFGGGGATFDWSLIPLSLPLPTVLSGGLHAENVAEAIRRIRPWAVDVSSGVESDVKGVKDARKIYEFISAVRTADAAISL